MYRTVFFTNGKTVSQFRFLIIQSAHSYGGKVQIQHKSTDTTSAHSFWLIWGVHCRYALHTVPQDALRLTAAAFSSDRTSLQNIAIYWQQLNALYMLDKKPLRFFAALNHAA